MCRRGDMLWVIVAPEILTKMSSELYMEHDARDMMFDIRRMLYVIMCMDHAI